ncbi:MAG TPA: type III PLP-dependent enzyme [Acidimicrobiales bacterium]
MPNAVELALVTPRHQSFLDLGRPTPYVAIDLDVVADRYAALCGALPGIDQFYAVKANPHPAVVAHLAALGCCFDVASIGEVDLCLSLGVDPTRISYGSTIKKRADVAAAWAKGVRMFAVDSEAELGKVIAEAPGALAYCRLACDSVGSDWPLSRKFGTDAVETARLMVTAAEAGLETGISFHVGSQQRDVSAWSRALEAACGVLATVVEAGVRPALVNIGGGFPVRYVDDIPPVDAIGSVVTSLLRARLGALGLAPQIIAEPGRYLVAEAGVLQASVVLVADRPGGQRWVYTDIGVFGGLAETLGESIRYRIRTAHEGADLVPSVVAGPTCDSTDVLYEKEAYLLPAALAEGDRIEILSAGAYTTAYSSVGFNGFAPLRTEIV